VCLSRIQFAYFLTVWYCAVKHPDAAYDSLTCSMPTLTAEIQFAVILMKNCKITNFYEFFKPTFKIRKRNIAFLICVLAAFLTPTMFSNFPVSHFPLLHFWPCRWLFSCSAFYRPPTVFGRGQGAIALACLVTFRPHARNTRTTRARPAGCGVLAIAPPGPLAR